MRLVETALLADENIHPDVLAALRKLGRDIVSVGDRNLAGQEDAIILRRAVAEDRVVMTHDRDFGKLAILLGEPHVGIVYLRPGHILPSIVLQMLDVLWSTVDEVEAPFVIVVERRLDTVRVRLRKVP